MLNLIGIKIKNSSCFLVSHHNIEEQRKYDYSNPYHSIEHLIVDGEHPSTSHHRQWSILKKEPKVIQKTVHQESINYRYELIDESMESDQFPHTYPIDFVADYVDGYWEWKDEYAKYRSLYTIVDDKQPDILEDVEFQYETILEVDKIPDDQSGWSYKACTKYERDPPKHITAKHIEHQLIDKIIFPPIILPTRPCSLSSQQSFDIVRKFVQQNINPKYAHITSDYDFCFTVNKRIKLAKQETYTVDVNNSIFQKRKRKPKIETRYRTERNVICFEMSPKPYQSYSIIDGFRGDDHEDLQKNIDDYCQKLIEYINEPIVDCKHCKGRGVTVDDE